VFQKHQALQQQNFVVADTEHDRNFELSNIVPNFKAHAEKNKLV
jgi:hypothetical protein